MADAGSGRSAFARNGRVDPSAAEHDLAVEAHHRLPGRDGFHGRIESHLEPLRRVHAVSDPSELLESLEFTWTFKALSERATRLDLALDFEMRSLEHAIMWDLAKDRILQEYVDSFKQRCDLLETAARAAAPSKRE